MNNTTNHTPGLIVLLGSGETLPSSGKVHEYVARQLPAQPRIAVMETPAGFEPNSDRVAGKIKEFLDRRLQNYNPEVEVVPARKRGTFYSPDNSDVIAPLLDADEILLGPGSPSYGARQLRGSLAAAYIAARHRLGATLFLSSSATLSFGKFTIPVYEIYKVGEDLHWKDGVDFFSPFGLPLVIVPHWDNTDGGEELDTSHCYVGTRRYEQLVAMLPPGQTILGIDEHTGLIIDPTQETCRVLGRGGITVIRDGKTRVLKADAEFPLSVLGAWQVPSIDAYIDDDVWQRALDARDALAQRTADALTPDEAVVELVEQRAAARAARDWAEADRLRDRIAELGWQVMDTQMGWELEPLS